MKNLIFSILAVLTCTIFLVGCTANNSSSVIHISSTGMPKTAIKTFVSDTESIYFEGNISAIGKISLEILTRNDDTLYSETFEDVSNQNFSVALDNLTPGDTYTLVLNGTYAVSFDLMLNTD